MRIKNGYYAEENNEIRIKDGYYVKENSNKNINSDWLQHIKKQSECNHTPKLIASDYFSWGIAECTKCGKRM